MLARDLTQHGTEQVRRRKFRQRRSRVDGWSRCNESCENRIGGTEVRAALSIVTPRQFVAELRVVGEAETRLTGSGAVHGENGPADWRGGITDQKGDDLGDRFGGDGV